MFLYPCILALTIVMAGCSFTTANLTDLKMASAVDEDSFPTTVTNVFQTNSAVIYATGAYNNAPEGTTVAAEWHYLDATPTIYIDDAILTVDGVSGQFSFSLSKPTNGWPTGSYEVRFFIDDIHVSTLPFTVE